MTSRLRHGIKVARATWLFSLLLIAHAAHAQTAFVYPLLATAVSSDFGKRKHPVLKVHRHHGGIDLAAPEGTPIRAVKGGVVVFADPHGAYGNLIVIDHGKGLTTHYGHCASISVRTGQRIKAGTIIGTVGATGRVTGPHLHFEARKEGKILDPALLFPGLGAKPQG